MHAVLGLSIKWQGHIEEASVILTIAASVVLQWLASSNQPERWRCAVASFLWSQSHLTPLGSARFALCHWTRSECRVPSVPKFGRTFASDSIHLGHGETGRA